ncbi:MAG TPA: alpha-glucan family phosphorylase [Candidatus Deferrimicrobium sp.]|nr:alpha-glucan family phosphorylase [Candidatus Deferrimicrobium sp.]
MPNGRAMPSGRAMPNGRAMPPGLEWLAGPAFDLRLSSSKTLAGVWRRIDPEAWDRTNNPWMVLQHAHVDQLEKIAADKALQAELHDWLDRHERLENDPGWFVTHHSSAALKGVAYFSMEFGLSEALPIYSGGLGILAGDHLKSASDLNVPIVGIGLLYQQGYFRQVIAADGSQVAAYPFNDPGSLPVTPFLDEDGHWPRIRLELPGRTVLLRVWRAKVGRNDLYLLDANHPLNSPWDRGITANLYAAGREQRLLQELVLGVGGWRLLERLGLEVDVCHLNEGHAAFAVIARAVAFAEANAVDFAVALRATRAGNVFTTHTPVEAAFDRFDPELVLDRAGPIIHRTGLSDHDFLALGRRDPDDHLEPFNMAYLALQCSCHVNGVAQLHGVVSRRLFRGLFPRWPERDVPIGAITNGVHVPTWHSELASELWVEATGEKRWLGDVAAASRAMAKVSDERLWEYRAEARRTLVDVVRERLERMLRVRNLPENQIARARHVLDPNVLTLGWARRFATYKRPNLLLYDPERLTRLLLDRERPIQIVFAGKAHPDDGFGREMVREIARFGFRDDVRDHIVFLEDYDMVLGQYFAAGVDVWLNNPRRPNEASGTSGMKMLVNGGLNASTLDGWWDEAYTPEVGWAIGDDQEQGPEHDWMDAAALYDLIERQIVPEFYDRDKRGIPRAWLARVRASMSRLTEPFSSDRMVRQYVEQAYLPAAQAYRLRAAEGGREAGRLEEWHRRIADEWPSLRFGPLEARKEGESCDISVQVYLAELTPGDVRVELVSDAVDGAPSVTIPMETSEAIPGAVNVWRCRVTVPADRPVGSYTPRIMPANPLAMVPVEAHEILWWDRSAGAVIDEGEPPPE